MKNEKEIMDIEQQIKLAEIRRQNAVKEVNEEQDRIKSIVEFRVVTPEEYRKLFEGLEEKMSILTDCGKQLNELYCELYKAKYERRIS